MVADTEASRDTRPHLNPFIHDRSGEGGGGEKGGKRMAADTEASRDIRPHLKSFDP